MEILDLIKSRRSIRDFEDKQVADEIVDKILECGMYAPSSKNSQPWKFYVIKNKDLINELGDIMVNSENLYSEPCDPWLGKINDKFRASIKASGFITKKAPVLIVVENTCPFSHNRAAVMKGRFEGRAIGGHDSELISLGAAIENISLAAHALGLGTVIICDILAEEEKVKQKLGLKGDLIAFLPLGYSSQKPGPKDINVDCVEYVK